MEEVAQRLGAIDWGQRGELWWFEKWPPINSVYSCKKPMEAAKRIAAFWKYSLFTYEQTLKPLFESSLAKLLDSASVVVAKERDWPVLAILRPPLLLTLPPVLTVCKTDKKYLCKLLMSCKFWLKPSEKKEFLELIEKLSFEDLNWSLLENILNLGVATSILDLDLKPEAEARPLPSVEELLRDDRQGRDDD